tara:strand:+ start:120 stop:326 length:207 start_codon:yes stop_codon:yes gene_type:complete
MCIPDYSETESVFVLKAHHCLADGLGFSALFLALSDVYDKNALPGLKPLSFCKKVIVNMCLPFLVLRA